MPHYLDLSVKWGHFGMIQRIFIRNIKCCLLNHSWQSEIWNSPHQTQLSCKPDTIQGPCTVQMLCNNEKRCGRIYMNGSTLTKLIRESKLTQTTITQICSGRNPSKIMHIKVETHQAWKTMSAGRYLWRSRPLQTDRLQTKPSSFPVKTPPNKVTYFIYKPQVYIFMKKKKKKKTWLNLHN